MGSGRVGRKEERDAARTAESEQLPGVRVRCNPHPGILGLAPSAELRQRATGREAEMADRGGFVLPPESSGPCLPKGR